MAGLDTPYENTRIRRACQIKMSHACARQIERRQGRPGSCVCVSDQKPTWLSSGPPTRARASDRKATGPDQNVSCVCASDRKSGRSLRSACAQALLRDFYNLFLAKVGLGPSRASVGHDPGVRSAQRALRSASAAVGPEPGVRSACAQASLRDFCNLFLAKVGLGLRRA